jgi:hypothetical protein
MYGYDTHSWRNSTEKRQLDKERKQITDAVVLKPDSVLFGPICNCRSFRLPHFLEVHRKALRSDYDWSLDRWRLLR